MHFKSHSKVFHYQWFTSFPFGWLLTVKNKKEKKKKASQGNMLEPLTVHSLKFCPSTQSSLPWSLSTGSWTLDGFHLCSGLEPRRLHWEIVPSRYFTPDKINHQPSEMSATYLCPQPDETVFCSPRTGKKPRPMHLQLQKSHHTTTHTASSLLLAMLIGKGWSPRSVLLCASLYMLLLRLRHFNPHHCHIQLMSACSRNPRGKNNNNQNKNMSPICPQSGIEVVTTIF